MLVQTLSCRPMLSSSMGLFRQETGLALRLLT